MKKTSWMLLALFLLQSVALPPAAIAQCCGLSLYCCAVACNLTWIQTTQCWSGCETYGCQYFFNCAERDDVYYLSQCHYQQCNGETEYDVYECCTCT